MYARRGYRHGAAARQVVRRGDVTLVGSRAIHSAVRPRVPFVPVIRTIARATGAVVVAEGWHVQLAHVHERRITERVLMPFTRGRGGRRIEELGCTLIARLYYRWTVDYRWGVDDVTSSAAGVTPGHQ